MQAQDRMGAAAACQMGSAERDVVALCVAIASIILFVALTSAWSGVSLYPTIEPTA
jgi:hypothetical protein